MLCAPVFIFTSSSSALLGRPRCGLSIWLSLLAIFNTLFGVYGISFFTRKRTKDENTRKSSFFVIYENGRRRLRGAQSINTERASLILSLSGFVHHQAHLQPVDDVTIVYEVKGASEAQASQRLDAVITSHKEYIENSVKQPLVSSPPPPSLQEIIHEETEVAVVRRMQ